MSPSQNFGSECTYACYYFTSSLWIPYTRLKRVWNEMFNLGFIYESASPAPLASYYLINQFVWRQRIIYRRYQQHRQ